MSRYGLLFSKDISGASGDGGCDGDGSYESAAWPLVETEWAHTPDAGPGVAAALGTFTDGDKHYLTINGCVAYHFTSAVDVTSALSGVTAYWPVFKPDGTSGVVSCA